MKACCAMLCMVAVVGLTGCGTFGHSDHCAVSRSSVPSVSPLPPGHGPITSKFGMRGGEGEPSRLHKGLDIAAPKGTPVFATADGIVGFAGWNDGGYGRLVTLWHGAGYETRYAHLKKCEVDQGQRVRQGQCIGRVGATGRATGPHLHYEVRQNGQPKDPLEFWR